MPKSKRNTRKVKGKIKISWGAKPDKTKPAAEQMIDCYKRQARYFGRAASQKEIIVKRKEYKEKY